MGKERWGETSEREGDRVSSRELGREVNSIFEATAYLSPGLHEAWQREVLHCGV